MQPISWPGRRHSWLDRPFGERQILIYLVLLGSGLAAYEGAAGVTRRVWVELTRPVAIYRDPICHGLAISLNGLEKRLDLIRQLPGIEFRGVELEPDRDDWILFGEEHPERRGLPVEALAVAVRAVRLFLESPGVDIRPGSADGVQRVQYFGGVEHTLVGEWFFRFDSWMKLASSAKTPVPISGAPIYWNRSVDQLEHDVASCRGRETGSTTRWNRYWLCAGEFTAIEDNSTLVFQRTPLEVLAEGARNLSALDGTPGSACASRGTDDELAAEYARWLNDHLMQLDDVVPVHELHEFARLIAGFAWLGDTDPYRNLRPWIDASLSPADTPPTVPTVSLQAVREHRVAVDGATMVHRHQIELSGGVLLAPTLIRARSGDDALHKLRKAIESQRPEGDPVTWRFTFDPSEG